MEAFGGQLDFASGSLNLRRQGLQVPLRAYRAGHYILSVVDFRRGPSRITPTCQKVSVSFLHLVHDYPDLSYGGPRLPYTPDALSRFETPVAFAACESVALRGARDGCPTDPEKIATKLHVNWGHASAQQLRRALMGPQRYNMHLLTSIDDV